MRRRTLLAVSLLTSLLAAASHAQQAEADARAARYLAGNCANCHGTTGSSVGAMPSLAGQSKTFIVEQMRAFREGKRPATIMHQISKGYSEQQTELIAEYFSRQTAAR